MTMHITVPVGNVAPIGTGATIYTGFTVLFVNFIYFVNVFLFPVPQGSYKELYLTYLMAMDEKVLYKNEEAARGAVTAAVPDDFRDLSLDHKPLGCLVDEVKVCFHGDIVYT